MAKYLVEASYTQQGLQGLLKSGGSSRRKVIQDLAKSLGGSVEAFYFAFGENDVYVLLDLPGNVDAAATSLVTSASGAVSVKVTVLLTPEEVDEATKRSVSYTPPGASRATGRPRRR